MKPLLSLPLFLALACGTVHAADITWQPATGHAQIPIWPGKVPNGLPNQKPETLSKDGGGVGNVSIPTMTVYSPGTNNIGVAVVVFPGGGYQMLAIKIEGTEICDWLTSKGITCVLLKYRVPNSGPTWTDKGRYYPKVQTALQDAQRTLGLVREHATEWHIDPHKVGVMGFSAGGHLVAAVSTHFDKRTYPVVDAADQQSARPDFAVAAYPGHLWIHEDDDKATRNQEDLRLRPDIHVTKDTPPTFIVMAEDDHTDGVEQSVAYYVALQKANVPTELHLYAKGGHAFGLRKPTEPVGAWPALVETWLQSLGMLPPRK